MHRPISYPIACKSLSLKEKVGQLFMPAAFINDTEEEIQQLEHLIRKYHIGSICFFHSRASAATNFEGKKSVVYNAESYQVLKNLIQRYQKAAKHPLLIAIDAEWGLAMRVENTPQYPYNIALGAIQENNDLIFEVGKNIAKDCKAAGIHWNLAPCIDINNNPNNPVIGYRSFGSDKTKVLEKALAFIKGTQSEGILTSIKHFPGHGDTATDSHLGLPLIAKSKEELIDNELYPFQNLLDEGIDSVMVGHLSVPSLNNGERISSSISPNMIKGFLREEMGYSGVVISDALNMHSVSKNHPEKGKLEWLAFNAGNDVLCFAENVPEGINTIIENASEKEIEESFERVWRLKEKAIVPISNTGLTDPKPLNQKIAEKSLTQLKGAESDIADFRAKNFCTITMKRSVHDFDTSTVLNSLKEMRKEVVEEEYVLMLITPPKAKPANYFGFLKEEIEFMNTILKEKNVVVYLFGNPYFLNHLESSHAVSIVLAYQDFKEFQDVATAHFLGKAKACGKLPVSLR